MNARNARPRIAKVAETRNSSERPRSLDLARRVRALRSKSGMTLKELSARSGISISALSKLENGQLSPTYENIVRLAMEGGGGAFQRAEHGGRDQARHTDRAGQGSESDGEHRGPGESGDLAEPGSPSEHGCPPSRDHDPAR